MMTAAPMHPFINSLYLSFLAKTPLGVRITAPLFELWTIIMIRIEAAPSKALIYNQNGGRTAKMHFTEN